MEGSPSSAVVVPGAASPRTRAAPPLRLGHKLAYGIGQAAEGVKNNAFELLLFFYYNQVLGVPGTLAGAAVAIALLFDAVTDPLTGSLSDSLRSRWGRRHPFMYASAIPLAITFFLVFNPPPGLSVSGLFTWLCVFAVLTRTAMTLYHVPHLALGAELSNDYQERTNIVAYRVLFGLIGVVLVSVVGLAVFFPTTEAFARGQLNPAGYRPFSTAFAAFMAVAIVWSGVGTHSRIPHLPGPPEVPERFSTRRLTREMGEALSIASFRALFLGLVVFFVMRGIQFTLGLHVNTHFWDLASERIAVVMLATAVGIIVGLPFFTLVARKIDKKPTFLLGVIWFTGFHLLPIVLKLWIWFPANDSALFLPLLGGCAFLAAFGGAAGLVTAGSMLADLADEHELATGRRQEGIFFGAQSFSGKAASGLGHLIAGAAIDWIGFPENAVPGSVAPDIIDRLGILYGPGIVVLGVISVLFLMGYSLTHERHAEIARALADRRGGG